MQDFVRINKEYKISILLNIHHVDLALKYCDRVIGIRAGEIVFDGPASTITQEQIDEVYNGAKAPTMGEGEGELGKNLLKAFLYALSQQESLPETILFYNGGASLTCQGSLSLEDLKSMAERGVEILTCGTCLNFYGLTEMLAVGGVTNMYDIVEKQMAADLIVRP